MTPEIKRDRLGYIVREVWIAWARTQPSPLPQWLVPYHKLSDAEREAWCLVAEAARRRTLP